MTMRKQVFKDTIFMRKENFVKKKLHYEIGHQNTEVIYTDVVIEQEGNAQISHKKL